VYTCWLAGAKIRIPDIGAPEVTAPRFEYEKQLGDKATFQVLELVNKGPFEVSRSGDLPPTGWPDFYFRDENETQCERCHFGTHPR
jgi:hypothetical protein